MDSHLYVWAKRPELQRDLVRPAGETAAQDGPSRHAEEQETKRGREIMLPTEEQAKATMHMKAEERRRAHLISEAREQAQHSRNGRAWHWRIEPGMEDAFQDLQGWLLSSQRDAEMETANSPPGPSVSAGSEADPKCEPQPSAWAEGKGRPASEPESLPA
jgi:hypothetical protein